MGEPVPPHGRSGSIGADDKAGPRRLRRYRRITRPKEDAIRGEAHEPGMAAHLDAGVSQAQEPSVEPVPVDVQIVAPIGLGAAAVPVVHCHRVRFRFDSCLRRHHEAQGLQGLLGVGGQKPTATAL